MPAAAVQVPDGGVAAVASLAPSAAGTQLGQPPQAAAPRPATTGASEPEPEDDELDDDLDVNLFSDDDSDSSDDAL